MGQYELEKSIGALPLLMERLRQYMCRSGSAQLAHVRNRFFTALESKGILRSSPEEFLLASRCKSPDELAAEFMSLSATFERNFSMEHIFRNLMMR